MLSIFSSCDRYTKSKLLQGFCLSLYGASLWMVSSPDLHSLEVSLNSILRKTWSLPQRCYTGILQLVGNVSSLYTIVISRSNKLILSALKPQSSLLTEMFNDCKSLVYTSFGYISVYGYRHWKHYSESEELCATFIRDARLSPSLSLSLNEATLYNIYNILMYTVAPTVVCFSIMIIISSWGESLISAGESF